MPVTVKKKSNSQSIFKMYSAYRIGAKSRLKREELLNLVRQRKIDCILVWRLDRFGGSLADLITTLDELNSLGVSFVSLNESLDLTTPSGKALAGMLAVFAEFERSILKEPGKSQNH